MKRAGIYTRVSTAMQKERYSLPAQEAMLRDYAAAHDLDVVDHYQDAGLSAKDTNRPALQRLMQDCRDGRLDVVLTVEMDRTTRSVEDMLTLSRFFQEHGVEYRELTDPDTSIDTPDGFLKRTIKSTISQYERLHTGDRTRRVKLHRAQQGKRTGGSCPFGYTSQGRKAREGQAAGLSEAEAVHRAVNQCPERGRLYVDPDEAQIVREIFDTFLQVNSLRQTARRLNQAGKRTHGGYLWQSCAIHRILINPVYVGKVRSGMRPVLSNGTRKRVDSALWSIADGEHEAIITAELFEAAQRMLPDRAVKPRKPGYVYLLSGVLRCGYCGGVMAAGPKRRGEKWERYYRCARNGHYGRSVCRGQWWRVDALETYVIDYLRGLSDDGNFLADSRHRLEEVETALQGQAMIAELERLSREIQKNRQRLDRLMDKLQDGLITDEDFKARYDQVKADIEGLESTRDRLRDQVDHQEDRLGRMQASFDSILNVWQDWESLGREQQKQRLRVILDKIVLQKDQGEVEVRLIVGSGFDQENGALGVSPALGGDAESSMLSEPVKGLLLGYYSLSLSFPKRA